MPNLYKVQNHRRDVATPLWRKCEVAIHTPKNGTWESSGTLKNLELNCRGQNTSPWTIFYTIEKVSKFRCLKWPCMNHLDIYNTSYGWKKGWESNWQFDSRPLKVRNRPDPDVCRWSATHLWKALKDSYKFSLDLVSIGGRGEKLWTPKFPGVQTETISKLHFGSPGKKMPFRCKCGEEAQRILYGGRWWLPPSSSCGESSESKVARGLTQHQECSEWILTNLLVGFGCRTE
jgi:hypothetical protein